MSILEFIKAIQNYLMKICSEYFTGKIVITLNLHKGGIGNVQVSVEHNLQKIDSDKKV
jgi:hypothetical protein